MTAQMHERRATSGHGNAIAGVASAVLIEAIVLVTILLLLRLL